MAFLIILKDNWKGVCLGLLLVFLIIAIPAGLISREAEIGEDYLRLAHYGKIIEGRIVEYKPYRFVHQSSKRGAEEEEGMTAAIEYRDRIGEKQILYETWPGIVDSKAEDKIDEIMMLYYLPSNRHVQAATISNPRLQIVLKSLGKQAEPTGPH